jgi:hypothetical protein
MYVTRNSVARSRNQCCSGKVISITYSEFVSVALIIQLANAMHHIILVLSSVAFLALPFFPTLYYYLWPVWLYRSFPNFIIICGLSGSTILSKIIVSSVACLALPFFPTLYYHLWPL